MEAAMSIFRPQMGSYPTLISALSVWTFSTACSFYSMLTNTALVNGARTFAAPCKVKLRQSFWPIDAKA